MYEEEVPVDRNIIPEVEYKPREDFESRIAAWLRNFQAPTPMSFDPASLQELWRQMQQTEQQQINPQEQLMQEMQKARNEAQAYKSMQDYGKLPGRTI